MVRVGKSCPVAGTKPDLPSLGLLKTISVIVGPNELSIRDASAIDGLMGAFGLPKGPCEYLPII